MAISTGGDLGGRLPQNLRCGGSPCICPPNISRSTVGCEVKYELSKKCLKEDFSEIEAFGEENGYIILCVGIAYIGLSADFRTLETGKRQSK